MPNSENMLERIELKKCPLIWTANTVNSLNGHTVYDVKHLFIDESASAPSNISDNLRNKV